MSALIEVLDLLIPARRSEIDLARPRFPSDPSLTAELVDRGWLTPLQRSWVLRGHGEKLLVGSYILLERVGEGGMGQVYLARHRALGRLAAIKLLRTERRDDHRSKRRFVREVRALGRLNHPNVVFAYDAGDAGRSLYLAMEYVPGPDLAQTLAAGGRLPPGLACEYARQAALGLQHMHERGHVHRDIKPSNLSLADGGRLLKVLDVGLVRDRERAVADAGLTRVGFLVGTPDYTAPEQVLDARRAGRRSDQYSLGCTLYELITGLVPFPAGSPTAKALRRLTEDARPADELRPDLPAGLARVVSRLLARNPKDRFPTSGAAAEALAPFAFPISHALPIRKGGDETSVASVTCSEHPTLDDRALEPYASPLARD